MKIDSVHAEFMSGNAVSSTTSSHSIVSRDASGDIQAAGVTISGNSGTLFSYTADGRTVYGGCNSDDPWFGTGSNHDLRLLTNGNERMRIDNTGNVAIGTTSSPIGKLDVRGAIIAPVVAYSSNQDEPYLVVGTPDYNGDPGNTGNWNLHGIEHRIKVDNGGVPRITVDMPSGGEVFTIKNGGNVGIGTTDPKQKLEVYGNILLGKNDVQSFIHGGSDMAVSSDTDILIVADSNDTSGGATSGDIIFGSGSAVNTNQNRDFTFAQAYPTSVPRNEHMRITGDGNVGIGTPSPDTKLTVSTGSITTSAEIAKFHSYYDSANNGYLIIEENNHTPNNNDWTGYGTRIQKKVDVTEQGYIEFNPEGGQYSIAFGNDTTEYMRIEYPDGHVGIGTTSPLQPLHVKGNGQNPVIYMTDGTNNRYASGMGTHNVTNEGQRLDFYNGDSGANGTSLSSSHIRMSINASGNVGINESSPTSKLHIDPGTNDTSSPSTTGVYVYNSGTGDSTCTLRVKDSNAGDPYVSFDVASEAGWALGMDNNDANKFKLSSHWDKIATDTKLTVLRTNGHVGIGTTSPDEKLEVRGDSKFSYNDTSAMHIDSGGTVRRSWYDSGSNTNLGSGFHFTNGAIWPTDNAGTYNNGDITFGHSSYRWRTVYTKDVNVKAGIVYCDPYTNTVNSPTSTGIDVNNALDGDATISLRVKDSGAGDPFISFDIANDQGWCLGVDNSDDNKFKLAGVWNNLASSTKLTVTTGGNVGIGTTTVYSKLHIHGGDGQLGESNGSTMHFAYDQYPWRNSASSAWSSALSIYATDDIASGGHILSSDGIISSSDERIKKNIVDADDTECLEALRLLKPKKYQYKDIFKKGEEPVWGFIAQEVRDTLPHATQMRRDFIPNIYELANVSSSNVITFTNFNTSNLEANATTLIKVTGIDDKNHDIHLVEVIDEHTIRVEEDLTEWIGSVDETGNVVDGNQLFVHGQQVDDFVYLKKESIFTVATAALQEVDRQLQAEKIKTANLTARVEELESMVSLIKLNMTWPDA